MDLKQHADRQVVVVGAGQAGLAAAYHLRRLGLRPEDDFTVLDANPGPGGAWRHRWPSLTLGRAHGIHDLPGLPLGTPDPTEPASQVVARYYGEYERRFELPVHRPVRVQEVRSAGPGTEAPLEVVTDVDGAPPGDGGAGGPVAASLRTRIVINATGTWDRPYWPFYPGREAFRGRQLHTHDFWSVEEFRDRRVVVVGGGTSAVQFLLQLAPVAAATFWVTRRPPVFVPREFGEHWGREVEQEVRERTRAGYLSGSVVSHTGLPLTPEYQAGIEAGVLVSVGAMSAVTPQGVRLVDGTDIAADAILWATGFRPSVDHLAPLRLREPAGGIRTEGVTVERDPRVLLAGYGSSASTLGATRAGRAAAVIAVRRLAAARSAAGAGPAAAGKEHS